MAEQILRSSRPPAGPRQKRARTREDDPRLGAEPNPFMIDDEESLPRVPDTRDWHFFWMRVQSGDKGDGKNIIRKMRSKWQYEYVRPDEMPDFRPNATKHEKIEGDVIQFNDLVLVKCPRIRYLQFMQAHESRMRSMRGQSTQRVKEEFGEHFYAPDSKDTEALMNDSFRAPAEELRDEFVP